MRFDVRCALDHLLQKGKVYTLRAYKTKRDVTFRLGVDGRLYRRRYIAGPMHLADLAPYLSESGFESPEAWWERAHRFAGSRPLFLYLVEKT